MQSATIIDWKSESANLLGKQPVQLTHSLQCHPLFSETTLTRVLSRLDRSDYYVNTMNVDAHDASSRREGELAGLSGEAIFQAVRQGRLWILIQNPGKAETGYQDLLKSIYEEMHSHRPDFKSKFHKLTILISSPHVQVYYHCDIPGQTLWQVQGEKRVHLYPNKPPFLQQSNLEKIALGEAHEISLPYNPAFDKHAQVFNLQPGRMLHWPLNAPHRIVNGDSMNISFTTEHFTPSERRSYYVNYANGLLRSRLGLRNLSLRTTGPSYGFKSTLTASHRLFRKIGRYQRKLVVDFAVDPNAPNSIRDIPPHELTL